MKNTSLVITALGIIALVVLFFILRSNQKLVTVAPNQSPAASIEESTASATPATNTKVFELVVKNNKLASGPETLQVTQGDTVTFRITADVDGELHLHGYDKAVEFKKDQSTDLTITASLSGHFPYELEDTKTEIGALEVLPH